MRGLLAGLALILGLLFLVLLIRDPSTRLIGIVGLTLGIVAVFAVPMFGISVSTEVGMPRYAPMLVLIAAGCFVLAALAACGSIERGQAGFAWKYGETVTAEVPYYYSCELYGDACSASWIVDGKRVSGRVSLSDTQQNQIDGAPEDGGDVFRFRARAFGDNAASAEYRAVPPSSAVLGLIPAWLGWAALVLGLGLGLVLVLLPTAPDDQPE